MLPKTQDSYTIKDAKNSDLNGVVQFHYPDIYDNIKIGSRMAELAGYGRSNVKVQDLPYDSYLFLLALATLEVVIDRAPRGFYLEDRETKQPILDVGGIGNGHEWLVLEVYKAYARFQQRIRESLSKPGPEGLEDKDVVQDGEADEQPATDKPD